MEKGSAVPVRHIILGVLTLIAVWVLQGVGSEAQAAEHASSAVSGTPLDEVDAAARRVPIPTPSETTLRFHRSGNVLWVVSTLWGLFVPALILFTGLSARLRDGARFIGRKWFFVICVYVVLYLLLEYVLDFPLSFYQSFLRLHEYGISNKSFGQWFGDSLKALMLVAVMGMLFLWIPYLL
nr:M48 family peptidase [Gammaproteobacteria bacterium]